MIPPILSDPAQSLVVPLAFTANVASVSSIVFAPRQILPMARVPSATSAISGSTATLTILGGSSGEIYDVTASVSLGASGPASQSFVLAVIDRQWSMPDGTAGWLDVHEFIQRLGLDETIAATDRNGDGGVDRLYLVGALIDAQAECEASIAARYALPLSAVPTMLKSSVYDIARTRLYPRGVPDAVADAARAARANVARIGDGRASLPGVAGVAPTASETSSDLIAGFAADRSYPDNLVDY